MNAEEAREMCEALLISERKTLKKDPRELTTTEKMHRESVRGSYIFDFARVHIELCGREKAKTDALREIMYLTEEKILTPGEVRRVHVMARKALETGGSGREYVIRLEVEP